MKKKVWIVIWGLKDGGAETLAREYAKLVNSEEFEATLLTMYPFTDTANYRHAKAAGLRILPIFKKRNAVTRGMRVLFGKWCVPFLLKRMIQKHKPDVIHFNSPMAHYFVPLQNQLHGMNILYTCHSEVSKHFFEEEEEAVRRLIQDPGLRLIALHPDMKEELDERFRKDDSVVIRNGVDFDRFRNTNIDRSAVRRSIGLAEDAYIVGHVGRFSKEKNHAFLLEVFRVIAERKPNAHLLLVGSGDLREEIEQKVTEMHLSDRVTILSHRSDVPELLCAMDVLVFPSFYEGLSVVLVEAQASGLKCVVSDSINPENYLTEKTLPVSLKQDAAVWADIALDDTVRNTEHGNIEDYDMNREIRRLEGLYRGQLDV